MNKIREKIKEILFYEVTESEMDKIMEIIKDYLAEAFYSGKEEEYLGCQDWQDTYETFDDWYQYIDRKDEE